LTIGEFIYIIIGYMVHELEPINRREFLRLVRNSAIALALTACGQNVNSGTRIEVGNREYSLVRGRNYSKCPQKYQGLFFNLANGQYTEKSTEGILLPQEDYFSDERSLFHWRDTKASPEILQRSAVFQDVFRKTEHYMHEAKKILGETYDENYIFPQAVACAVRKTLIYNSKASLGSLSPLDYRLKLGLTDCQEFTAATAYTLAHFGLPSDVVMHSYYAPDGSGRVLEHLYNALSINNRCWIIDATTYGKAVSLRDYIEVQEGIHNGPKFGIIKYDSVFPNHKLPWDDSRWTGSVSGQDRMVQNTIAYAMGKTS